MPAIKEGGKFAKGEDLHKWYSSDKQIIHETAGITSTLEEIPVFESAFPRDTSCIVNTDLLYLASNYSPSSAEPLNITPSSLTPDSQLKHTSTTDAAT